MREIRIYVGDALSTLRGMPAESVHCIITSPPYYGLRDYGVVGQIGLEASPEQYVESLVSVFREARRVLHPSGTLWLNLGDCYWKGAKHPTLKPKDLLGIPWAVAFALREDGWWLRSAITWAKRAPVPESIRDRPTSATEMIFLMAKGRRYFYDAEAVKEPSAQREGAKRNMRNFWLLGPEPFPGAHFATFPTEIPRRAVLAGTSEKGCCPRCRSPWERVIGRRKHPKRDVAAQRKETAARTGRRDGYTFGPSGMLDTTYTVGWQPTCDCGLAETVSCTVLDPFCGSGTTLLVASCLGRSALGIELNAEYARLAEQRIQQGKAPFAGASRPTAVLYRNK